MLYGKVATPAGRTVRSHEPFCSCVRYWKLVQRDENVVLKAGPDALGRPAFALGASEDAHAVSGEAYFTAVSFCVGERTSTYQSPYSGVLYGESVTRSLGDYYGPCTAAITEPAGYLSRRVFVYKWDERYRDWFLCRRSGWLYNSGSTYALSEYAPLGYPYNRWCGSGWYGTKAQGSVWHNGAWSTTERVWSGSNYYY